MTWASLLLVSLMAAATSGPRELTEAQRCELALKSAQVARMDQRRSTLGAHDHLVERVLTQMRNEGGLSEPYREARIRAQRKLEEMFEPEGLLHEAIYQTFTARFDGPRRVREALRGFKHLVDAKDRVRLVAEVIERALQYVPDVDLRNLHELGPRAAFLNLSAAQLRSFRDKWLIYDERDQFAATLESAVLGILDSGDARLVGHVESRGGWLRRTWARRRNFALPKPPTVINPDLQLNEIVLEGAAYFDPNELTQFITASSIAARGYFVSNHLNDLTQDQLRWLNDRADALGLKSSLKQIISEQVVVRARLITRARALHDQRIVARELTQALKRAESSLRYDNASVQATLGILGQTKSRRDALDLADKILTRVGEEGTAAQFTGVLVAVRDFTLTHVRGRAAETQALIEVAVDGGNIVGLDQDQLRKVESILADWARRLSGSAAEKARRTAARLELRPTKLPPMNPAALRRRLDETTRQIEADQHALAEDWRDSFEDSVNFDHHKFSD